MRLLLRRRRRIIRRRQKRFDSHEAAEAGALLRCEVGKAVGVQHRLTLFWRKFAKAAEGADYVTALIGR